MLTRLWLHEFWSWPYLSNQAIFPTWTKSHDKNLNILRTKRTFKMKYKAFCLFFNWENITLYFLKTLLFILACTLPVWMCSLQSFPHSETWRIPLSFSYGLITKMKHIIAWNLLLQKVIHQLYLLIEDSLHLGILILGNILSIYYIPIKPDCCHCITN